MIVNIRLFSTLRKYYKDIEADTPLRIELKPVVTVGELIARLGIPPDEVALACINGVARERSYILHDGDDIILSGPVTGG